MRNSFNVVATTLQSIRCYASYISVKWSSNCNNFVQVVYIYIYICFYLFSYHFSVFSCFRKWKAVPWGHLLQFDTFGFAAAELAPKQAEKEQQQRYCQVHFMHIAQWGINRFITSLKLDLLTSVSTYYFTASLKSQEANPQKVQTMMCWNSPRLNSLELSVNKKVLLILLKQSMSTFPMKVETQYFEQG